ncbi:MAG: response regulator [Opitutaceae bacterium]|nr:response regulator [Opitutaceae bacterium]
MSPHCRTRLSRLFGWLLALGVLTGLRAQVSVRDPEQGRSPVRIWTMRDYAAFPQNWSVRRDAEGRLYFGNRDGVLMYDGTTWKLLPMPGVFVRGIAFDRAGRLYAGAVDELGYFERNALGEWGPYVSLLPQVPPEFRRMADIRNVYALADGVYFVAERSVLRFKHGEFKAWSLTGTWNSYSFQVDGRVYLHRRDDALRVIEGDEIKVAYDFPEVRASRLIGFARLSDNQLLLAWVREGLAVLQDGKLTPWAPTWSAWFRSQLISRLRVFPNGTVGIATELGGIALFDRSGQLLQVIDRKSGLYSALARDMEVDAEGGLWMALNHGVAHVDVQASYSLFDELNGLSAATVRGVTRHENSLYAATVQGLYRLVPAQGTTMAHFEEVPGQKDDYNAVLSHDSGLLTGGRTRVQLLPSGGGAPQTLLEEGSYLLVPSTTRPDVVWSAGQKGVVPLRYQAGQWRAGRPLPGPPVEVRSIAEQPDGSLWIGSSTRGAYRWANAASDTVGEPEIFLESGGLPPGHGWLRVLRWKDALLVSGQHGLARWDEAAHRFVPSPFLPDVPGARPTNVYGEDPSHLWTSFGVDRQSVRIFRIDASRRAEALPQAVVQALGDIEVFYHENRDSREVLWVGGSFGLARVDLQRELLPPSNFAALVSQIHRPAEPSLSKGVFAWPHGKSDLDIHFSATTYRSGPFLHYQNKLEGYDDDWLAWSGSTSRSFTNLSAGAYTLRIRARDADGRLGREATLAFLVTPPWWDTGWAYLAYTAAGLLALYGLLRWRVHASERERQRLQLLVAERTCQLAESEKTLLKAKEAAEAANRAKSAFLASMSHELRTPLNSVLGYAQILSRSSELGVTARRGLDAIRRSGDHLLNLINEVLDLAKVESGRIELVPAPFELARFAQTISESFAQRAADKRLDFITPELTSLVETVMGDEPRLRQILINLLGNAFKFTSKGSVTWSMRRIPGDRIRIEVADTGVGIAPEEQAQIFQPFYQASGAPDLSRQGTGLGLSISTHLVQLMGGQLEVESQPGRGSRFWFEIPLPVVALAEGHAPAASETGSYIVGYRGRPRRILVVDDERTNREILIEMLEPLGFMIEEAEDAATARAAVARQAPDLVLLDLRMPGDDGFTLAREWCARRSLLGGKVLALSASVLPEQQADALAAGCDAFMAKPFRVEQLLRVMGSLIQMEWIEAESPRSATDPVPTTLPTAEIPWEAGLLRRLLSLAEHGDAIRLGEELGLLARRGAQWAAAVAPWQKLAVSYQMEALSRALEQTLRRIAPT